MGENASIAVLRARLKIESNGMIIPRGGLGYEGPTAWRVLCGFPTCREAFGRVRLTSSAEAPRVLYLEAPFVEMAPRRWSHGQRAPRRPVLSPDVPPGGYAKLVTGSDGRKRVVVLNAYGELALGPWEPEHDAAGRIESQMHEIVLSSPWTSVEVTCPRCRRVSEIVVGEGVVPILETGIAVVSPLPSALSEINLIMRPTRRA